MAPQPRIHGRAALLLQGIALFALLYSPPAVAGPAVAPHDALRPRDRSAYVIEVTPEMRRHSTINNVLYFTGVAWTAAALLLMLGRGWSRRMREVAARLTGRQPLQAAIVFALFSIAFYLLTFPLTLYGGFVVPHQFDLTDQSLFGWLGDEAKAAGVGLLFGAPIAAVAYYAIRRYPHRWWLPLWLGTIPLSIFLVVIQPVLIDPLFNDFKPLSDPVLKREILSEAARAGIEGGRVYEVDKSKQTKEMNAYVNGIGPTKRIVLWDTLLRKMRRDEILFVLAHEMGHYVLQHIWKGLAFSVLVSLVIFRAGFTLARRAAARWGRSWGFVDPADPASLPLLVLVGSLLAFVLSPVISGYSRHVEHQADVFALDLTHMNEAGARSFIAFAKDSKTNPYPPRFIEWWRFTHPSLGRRVAFALEYRPWEERGHP